MRPYEINFIYNCYSLSSLLVLHHYPVNKQEQETDFTHPDEKSMVQWSWVIQAHTASKWQDKTPTGTCKIVEISIPRSLILWWKSVSFLQCKLAHTSHIFQVKTYSKPLFAWQTENLFGLVLVSFHGYVVFFYGLEGTDIYLVGLKF